MFKLLMTAALAVGGYFGGKALGLWGAPAASGGGGGSGGGSAPSSPSSSSPTGYSGPMPPFQLTPYPGTGAWQSNSAYISQYQGALTYLAAKMGKASYDPGGVTGSFNDATKSAVEAFQADHGLKVDGDGTDTGEALAAAVALESSS